MSNERHIAVIGGGIAGLAAAHELTFEANDAARVHVHLFEATSRFGGLMQSASFAGRRVDMAADGFLARRPEAITLAQEIGMGASLIPMTSKGAAVVARGKVRPLPDGLALGVPTQLASVARSGILSPLGVARLALDLIAPMPDRRGRLADRALGPLIARRLGGQVADRLVEPMLGGIYAGGIAEASTAALYPLLLEVAEQEGSFMRALVSRAKAGVSPGPAHESGKITPAVAFAPKEMPAFFAVSGGMSALVDATVSDLSRRAVTFHQSSPVSSLQRFKTQWQIVANTQTHTVDGVIVATPAATAAALLSPHDADVATVLGAIPYASVAVVTFAFASTPLERSLYGTGLLVPRNTPAPSGRSTTLTTALTYLSHKWPHLARPGEFLLRASVGRFGDTRFSRLSDESLIEQVRTEVSGLIGLRSHPQEATVVRWPSALPQYRVHHLARIAQVNAAIDRLAPLALAGAAYNGVGIPACIGSGRKAARQVLEKINQLH